MPKRNQKKFSELFILEDLLQRFEGHGRIETLAQIPYKNETYPIYSLSLGSTDPKAPVLGIFGGVHGLEKIGTRVVLSYLRSLAALLEWDQSLKILFKRFRLITIPIVNPVGMLLHYRSNGNGVDLMRNAPVEASHTPKWSLVGGHRISPKLPWYRGQANAAMELEIQALIDFVKRESFSIPTIFNARCSLWLWYERPTLVSLRKNYEALSEPSRSLRFATITRSNLSPDTYIELNPRLLTIRRMEIFGTIYTMNIAKRMLQIKIILYFFLCAWNSDLGLGYEKTRFSSFQL